MMQTAYHRNWARMPIDVKDPSLVLYLPFWYPYSDMTGGTIYSYDTNRRVCAVVGALWGSQGRTFDGVDDVVTVPDSDALDLTDVGTLEAWVKVTDFTNRGWLIGRTAYGSYGLYYRATQIVAFGKYGTDEVASIGTIPLDTWTHITGVRSGGTNYIYINYILDNSGPGANWTALAADVVLGLEAVEVWRLKGILGEVRIYNRALSQLEILHNYQVTKWRYLG